MNQIFSRQISIFFHCTALTKHHIGLEILSLHRTHWRLLFCLLITEKLRCQLDQRSLNLHHFCLTKMFQTFIRYKKWCKKRYRRNWECCCSFSAQYQQLSIMFCLHFEKSCEIYKEELLKIDQWEKIPRQVRLRTCGRGDVSTPSFGSHLIQRVSALSLFQPGHSAMYCC